MARAPPGAWATGRARQDGSHCTAGLPATKPVWSGRASRWGGPTASRTQVATCSIPSKCPFPMMLWPHAARGPRALVLQAAGRHQQRTWREARILTAAMEGFFPSPAGGWVTSAPRKMTGCWNTGGLRRKREHLESGPQGHGCQRHLWDTGTVGMCLKRSDALRACTKVLAGKVTQGSETCF